RDGRRARAATRGRSSPVRSPLRDPAQLWCARRHRTTGLVAEPLGGVAEGTNEILEPGPDRPGVLEARDHRLRSGDEIVAELGDPSLPLGDARIGAPAGILDV